MRRPGSTASSAAERIRAIRGSLRDTVRKRSGSTTAVYFAYAKAKSVCHAYHPGEGLDPGTRFLRGRHLEGRPAAEPRVASAEAARRRGRALAPNRSDGRRSHG